MVISSLVEIKTMRFIMWIDQLTEIRLDFQQHAVKCEENCEIRIVKAKCIEWQMTLHVQMFLHMCSCYYHIGEYIHTLRVGTL